MTPTQYQALKAAILADGALNGQSDEFIADALNQASNPNVDIWKPSIPVSEMTSVIDWAEYASITAAKQNAYLALTQGSVIDATKASVRAAFGSIFSGQANTTAALTALAKRSATKFEALFTTSGVCAVFGQTLTPQDVGIALRNY